MKVIYVGVFNPNSTNYAQAIGFERAGCSLIRYEYRDRAREIGVDARDSELIQLCQQEKPDVFVIAKGNTINARVIVECNKITTTVLWFMDAVNAGHWNSELQDKIIHCNHVFCDKTQAVDLGLQLNPNTHFLCEGYDSDVDTPINVPQDIKVSFIGAPYGARASMCSAVGAKVIQGVYGLNHSRVVSRSQINLNSCTNNCASDRVYKILAAKGFMLTDSWYGMDKLFTAGKDFVVYTDTQDLRTKISYYLDHPEEREVIRANGFNSVQKYSRHQWASNIIKTISS